MAGHSRNVPLTDELSSIQSLSNYLAPRLVNPENLSETIVSDYQAGGGRRKATPKKANKKAASKKATPKRTSKKAASKKTTLKREKMGYELDTINSASLPSINFSDTSVSLGDLIKHQQVSEASSPFLFSEEFNKLVEAQESRNFDSDSSAYANSKTKYSKTSSYEPSAASNVDSSSSASESYSLNQYSANPPSVRSKNSRAAKANSTKSARLNRSGVNREYVSGVRYLDSVASDSAYSSESHFTVDTENVSINNMVRW